MTQDGDFPESSAEQPEQTTPALRNYDTDDKRPSSTESRVERAPDRWPAGSGLNGSGAGWDAHETRQNDISSSVTRAQAGDVTSAVKPIVIDLDAINPLPGYQRSAIDCIGRAAMIAYDLNHTQINVGHLILAISLDSKATLGMERRKLPIERARRAILSEVLSQEWRFDRTKQLPTTAKLSIILHEATKLAAERDNPAATLPDLLDALEAMHLEGRLFPDATKQDVAFDRFAQGVNTKLDTLLASLDAGLRDNSSRLQAAVDAMTHATDQLLEQLVDEEDSTIPIQPPFRPVEDTTPEPAPEQSILERMRNNIAALILL